MATMQPPQQYLKATTATTTTTITIVESKHPIRDQRRLTQSVAIPAQAATSRAILKDPHSQAAKTSLAASLLVKTGARIERKAMAKVRAGAAGHPLWLSQTSAI